MGLNNGNVFYYYLNLNLNFNYSELKRERERDWVNYLGVVFGTVSLMVKINLHWIVVVAIVTFII